MLFEMDSSYVNFVRDIGSGGQRLDLAPRVSYPFSPGGLFTITPRVGFHETLYDTEVVGTSRGARHRRRGHRQGVRPPAPSSRRASTSRRARTGCSTSTARSGSRSSSTSSSRGSATTSSAATTRTTCPQWDGIDVITPSNIVTYSLINRLKARAVGEDERPGPGVGGHPVHPQPDVHGRPHPDLERSCSERRATPSSTIIHHHAQAPLGRGCGPHPRAALRRALPGHGGVRPLRRQDHGRHHRPLLRGSAVAGVVRHAPRRGRPLVFIQGAIEAKIGDSLDGPVLEQLQHATPGP